MKLRHWHFAAAIAGIGAVVMIAGTFAPWLKSGEVTRNSYRTAGLLQRLLQLHGPAGTAVDALPLLGVLCAATTVIFVAGGRRTAIVVLSILALAMGLLAATALAAPRAQEVRIVHSGPIITLAGSIVTIFAAMDLAILWRVDKRASPNPVSSIAYQAGELK